MNKSRIYLLHIYIYKACKHGELYFYYKGLFASRVKYICASIETTSNIYLIYNFLKTLFCFFLPPPSFIFLICSCSDVLILYPVYFVQSSNSIIKIL